MNEAVLLINFKDQKKLRMIQGVLMANKVKMKKVTKEEYAQSVGALLGMKELYKENAIYEGEDLEKEMMVFAGFSSSRLNHVLNMMHKKKISKTDYKAMLTETNAGWSVIDLYEELSKEHARMNSEK